MAVVALLEERHFGRAARRLGVSQPALTARLRRLEAQIGVRLFQRDRSGVVPTPAGIAYIEGARRVIEAATAAVEAARSAEDGFGGLLRIGFTQIAACQMVADVLAAFRRAHPLARLSLSEGTSSSLERGLGQSMVDVAFLHPPLYAPGLSVRPLARATIRCRNLHSDGSGRPPIGGPRHEAPALTSEIDRVWDRLAEASAPAPRVEADTMLGALVLSAAGYGAALAIDAFPDFGFETVGGGREDVLDLRTSIAWRSLDRRPVVKAFLGHALATSDLDGTDRHSGTA